MGRGASLDLGIFPRFWPQGLEVDSLGFRALGFIVQGFVRHTSRSVVIVG